MKYKCTIGSDGKKYYFKNGKRISKSKINPKKRKKVECKTKSKKKSKKEPIVVLEMMVKNTISKMENEQQKVRLNLKNQIKLNAKMQKELNKKEPNKKEPNKKSKKEKKKRKEGNLP